LDPLYVEFNSTPGLIRTAIYAAFSRLCPVVSL